MYVVRNICKNTRNSTRGIVRFVVVDVTAGASITFESAVTTQAESGGFPPTMISFNTDVILPHERLEFVVVKIHRIPELHGSLFAAKSP